MSQVHAPRHCTTGAFIAIALLLIMQAQIESLTLERDESREETARMSSTYEQAKNQDEHYQHMYTQLKEEAEKVKEEYTKLQEENAILKETV